MGTSTNSMAMFNGYVKLLEGIGSMFIHPIYRWIFHSKRSSYGRSPVEPHPYHLMVPIWTICIIWPFSHHNLLIIIMEVSWHMGAPSYHPFHWDFPWNRPAQFQNPPVVEPSPDHFSHADAWSDESLGEITKGGRTRATAGVVGAAENQFVTWRNNNSPALAAVAVAYGEQNLTDQHGSTSNNWV